MRETKADLRMQLKMSREETRAAEVVLKELGYDYAKTFGPNPKVEWHESPYMREIAARREAQQQVELAAALEQGRREALTKVIEALELKEYDTTGRIGIYSPNLPLAGPQPDRFWADLNTTLEAREAEKHAATVAATRKRVEALKPRVKFGESVTLFLPNDASPIVGLDLSGIYHVPDDTDRPEKAPQGLVGDVAKTAKKAKKKEASS